jgi:HEAT repeat protein
MAADADDERGWRFVGELHRRGDEETLDAAIALTLSDDENERFLGVEILSQIGYEHPDREPLASRRARAAQRLLELLGSDPDSEVVSAAISGLGTLSAIAALDAVLAFADDPRPELRLAVAQAFPGLCGWGTELDELAAADASRVFETLAALASDEDGDVRDWAVFVLGRQYTLDSPELRELFVQHLDDPDAGVRAEATVALARRRDRRALPTLLGLLTPEAASEQALEAAAYLADDALLPNLQNLVGAGWTDNSTLDAAICNCDPKERERWDTIARTLASCLRAQLEAQLEGARFEIAYGWEPHEWHRHLTAAWTRPDGTRAELRYAVEAFVDVQLDGNLEAAAETFRADIQSHEAPEST